MNTRIIAAALAFFTTFGSSSLLMRSADNQPEVQNSCWNYRKPVNKQVLRFLEKDIRNGQQRFNSLSHYEWQYAPPFSPVSLAEYSDAVAEYVAKSGGMDDSQLPADLQTAWRAHMKAWRNYSAFLNSLENLSPEEMSERSVIQSHREKDARITSTWFEVLQIAGDNYGAYPANAY